MAVRSLRLVEAICSRKSTRAKSSTRPVAFRSAIDSITRGAKFANDAPLSGSVAISWVMRNWLLPSVSMPPTCVDNCASRPGSTHTVPGTGTARVGSPRAPLAATGSVVIFIWPRSG